jgi:hypothetical protein
MGRGPFSAEVRKAVGLFVAHGSEEEEDFLPNFISKDLKADENDKLAKDFINVRIFLCIGDVCQYFSDKDPTRPGRRYPFVLTQQHPTRVA